MPGNSVAKGSVLSKVDAHILKADLKKPGQFPSNLTEKKPIMMPAYSIDSQNFSLGHMEQTGSLHMSQGNWGVE